MLKKIKLQNFRNHKSLEIDLKRTTILIGANGIGKSNILEAISLLSFCRSFRNDDKKNLVHFECDYTKITGDDLEVFIQKNPNFIFRAKDRGVLKKQAEFIGRLRSVVFSPETISIITGSPSSRRKFLDIMISQKDRVYLQSLIDYEKVRKERNSLLTRISQNVAKEGELDFWNSELIAHGESIIKKRKETLDYINREISKIYGQISGRGDQLSVVYINNAGDSFKDALKANHRREIAAGRTLIGPHRDDLIFNLNFINMANFASRGEIRSAILALKICELRYLSIDSEMEPILLLDDVFSEFDQKRREHLCELIAEYQSVITTTDKEHFASELLNSAFIIELEKINGKN
jgi:DNA replication and repair protein RecF